MCIYIRHELKRKLLLQRPMARKPSIRSTSDTGTVYSNERSLHDYDIRFRYEIQKHIIVPKSILENYSLDKVQLFRAK